MQDHQLYEQILGLQSPWSVKRVNLETEAQRIVVEVACDPAHGWLCPECNKPAAIHGYELRQWRHLDSCQFQTILQAQVPRLRCPEHGTAMAPVPWAEPFSRFTRLFERFAIDLLLQCSIAASCDLLSISWDQADGIKQRAVKRGLKCKNPEVMERLCVDEKSFSWGHDYITIVASVAAGRSATVEFLADGRKKESLDAFWKSLNDKQKQGVASVCMDMWEPYFQSTVEHLPGAQDKIVHDPFHLSRYVNKSLNEVRKNEHRILSKAGDDRLKNSRFLWLWSEENLGQLKEATRKHFEWLRKQGLQTARAWQIKEMWGDFWGCLNKAQAAEFFALWYAWAMRSRLEPIKKVARLFKKHLAHILSYFEHRHSNGPLEGLNNKIQALIKKAYGYRNKERFKTDLFFHLGGLHLYPN